MSEAPAESNINHPSTSPDTGNGNHPPPSHRWESSPVVFVLQATSQDSYPSKAILAGCLSLKVRPHH
ncbi:hypothetical protein PtA15_11A282 [Puccinia triticina]|uniref:Uncharacterized protein n=1 Tax=Puccinia triticina TaxID=208348 RepID=A0ABY7D3U5_9BASI|nr:uncharacterized protein PtA15_11A282 [Puccinia triticina]WAQ89592.1 hypothetical protein PtA15_11A282 [Puccinia triticina]WAR59622.1 hypothetical protein PtB15_11B262 [Puccinia triticina]